ncbi:unnamed protein product, partial [Tetraodon nigroviridis]
PAPVADGPVGRQEEGGALCGKDAAAGQQQDQVDFFSDATFSRDTYEEIEDGTGRVSQRPLLPASPDLALGASEVDWAGCPVQSGSLGFGPQRQASSPPTPSPSPSSSSALALAGAPYTGKVHFCHCGKAYTLKSMRDRHVKMQHLNLRPFGCPVCTKSFKMKHHLTKHLKTPARPAALRVQPVWQEGGLEGQLPEAPGPLPAPGLRPAGGRLRLPGRPAPAARAGTGEGGGRGLPRGPGGRDGRPAGERGRGGGPAGERARSRPSGLQGGGQRRGRLRPRTRGPKSRGARRSPEEPGGAQDLHQMSSASPSGLWTSWAWIRLCLWV